MTVSTAQTIVSDVPFDVVASDLAFPEGPVVLDDGAVLVVEVASGDLTRVEPDGETAVVAHVGDGPNGAAIGPDGAAYVCNNGNALRFERRRGLHLPAGPGAWVGGRIQRVDLGSGSVDTVADRSSTGPLRAPNDLVFDDHGGYWFTDFGLRDARSSDVTGVHYASSVDDEPVEVIAPLQAPNGIALSPRGDRLYVSETYVGRVWEWHVSSEGRLAGDRDDLARRHIALECADPTAELPEGTFGVRGARLVAAVPGLQLFDSMAVDSEGRVCVATIRRGGLTVIDPGSRRTWFIPLPDPVVTNVCFTPGDEHAYVTLAATGRLVRLDWRTITAQMATPDS